MQACITIRNPIIGAGIGAVDAAGDPAFRPLRRSFQPDDLIPQLRAAEVHVTVEAADNPAENEAAQLWLG